MKNLLKRIKLKIGRCLLLFRQRIIMYIGRFLFALCIVMFMLIACTNILHRVPVFTYFIEELKLPIALRICGEINIYENEQIMKDIPINIKIGGYEKNIYSGEYFELIFSATNTKDIPINIEYQIENEFVNKIEYVTYHKNEYVISRNFEFFE